jgi:hypothetical protein
VDSIKILRVPIDKMLELCDSLQTYNSEQMDDAGIQSIRQLLAELADTKNGVIRGFDIALQAKIQSYIEKMYRQAQNGEDIHLDEKSCQDDVQTLVTEYLTQFCTKTRAEFQQSSETIQALKLDLPNVPEVTSGTESGSSEADELNELLDILEKIPIEVPIPTPEPVPIPLPILVKAVRRLLEWIFGKDSKKPNIEEENEKQRRAARERAWALQELKNQLSIQMGDFSKQVNEAFQRQIEAIYQSYSAELNNLLHQKTGASAQAAKYQETISAVKSALDMLKQEIGSLH